MSIRHLDCLLEPRSVAVFGASDAAGSVGATVWRNLRAGSYAGPVFPVNPRPAVLDGMPVFASAAELPQAPHLAVLCTPPDTVAGLVDELGRLGTRAVVVMSSAMDARQTQAALDAARPHLVRLLGPDSLGLQTPHLGLNASFAHTDALAGSGAFVSQSGAVLTAVLDWAKSRRIGFSHMVALGSGCDVDFGDLLDYLASDARTRSILLYIESIESPRKFMSAARAAARNKPVIVVKAGRAGSGLRAAASHTGSLLGADLVFDAAIRRAGMLRVDTLQDLFMAAETLARFAGNRDEVLTVMTNGGGAGVMAADAAAFAGVTLAALGDGLRQRLDALLPANWSHGNPVDIVGDAPVQRHAETLRLLLAEPSAGAVLFLHGPTAIVRSDDIARACVPLVRAVPGRTLACWLGDAAVADARRIFEDAGVADYATPEEAVRAFALLGTYRRNQALLLEAPTASEHGPPDIARARAPIDAALAEGRELLDEVESGELLAAYGIPAAPTLAVPPDPAAAAAAARRFDGPVVLKIRSRDIPHKSDVGGVQLDLQGDDEVLRAAGEMLARVRAQRPQARIDGFTLQPLVVRPLAQELIVGAAVDPVFGPVLLFGRGGTAVEVLPDRAVGLPPLNRVLAREMVARTQVSRLLAGFRDHPPARVDAVCDVLIALSQMLVDLPELAEIDINPLAADHQGVIALDAQVRITPRRPAGAANFAIVPYPVELTETVIWQGTDIVLRPIRPEDEPQHRAFSEQMAPQDLRLRFFSARKELPRSELARLTQIDYAREMAFIAVRRRADGSAETLGVVRVAIDPDNVDAEFALTVRSDLKGHGLGLLLMNKMIAYLAGRGTQRMVGQILRENDAMRSLARTLGFVVDTTASDGEALAVELPLAAAAPAVGSGMDR